MTSLSEIVSLAQIIWICEIYFLICQSFQVGKDATSYRMKDKQMDPLTTNRLKRWHRDGVIQAFLSFLPCAFACFLKGGWPGLGLISACVFLIRMSFYDISFNKWAGLDLGFFGTTPKSDALFIWAFGTNGAVRKALAFTVALIIIQFLIHG